MKHRTIIRPITSLLILSMLFVLCACGNNHTTDNKSISEKDVRSHKVVDATDLEYAITDNECAIIRYFGKDDIAVIPDNINGNKVTKIEAMAFKSGASGKMRGVMLPSTITKLDRTFIDSSELEVVICEGVEEIGFASFAHCGKLHTVVLGSKLKTIGESAFYNCSALETLSIDSNDAVLGKNIESTVFAGCPDSFYVNVKTDSELAKQCMEIGVAISKADAEKNTKEKEEKNNENAESSTLDIEPDTKTNSESPAPGTKP